ncbi:serine hydrolase [Rubrobacter indicoceani]|uniref:serine hydrolase n=1 Tax=Rubrobacter indicoceani TaxID=2051957 RepID=UPI000E5A1082|nr:serine hydrolase [Rubrobacter indicoceani]
MQTRPRQPRPLKRSPQARRRIRRRRFGLLFVTLLLLAAAGFAVVGIVSLVGDAPGDSAVSLSPGKEGGAPENDPAGRVAEANDRPDGAARRAAAEGPAPEPAASPAAAAYRSLVADGGRETPPEELIYVQQSVSEPGRAAVWFAAPERKGRDRYFVFFTEKVADKEEWRVNRSVVAGDQEFPRDLATMIPGVPEDLKRSVLRTGQNNSDTLPTETSAGVSPEEAAVQAVGTATDSDGWQAAAPEESGGFHGVGVSRNVGGNAQATTVYLRESDGGLSVAGIGAELTGADLPGFPAQVADTGTSLPEINPPPFDPTTPVYDDGARESLTERGVEEAARTVEEYPGVAGFYVMDPKDGSGYGVRPDEEFFSASTIKIAVMAAVYRKIESGELEYSDMLTTTEGDWAAGAGWLRWNTPGADTTVEDALWLMMTESDNVATNVLLRTVGGPEYVNSVSRDLGAENTNLFWKLSSERAAVPELDNRTTPRDMATMLAAIYSGDGLNDFSRNEMIDLMRQNSLEYWLEGGIPGGVTAANKGGWQDGIYNDAGIVERDGSPYVLAIYTMNGPELEVGSPVLAEISGSVWLAESGRTKKEAEEDRTASRDQTPNSADDPPEGNPPEGNPSGGDRPQRD